MRNANSHQTAPVQGFRATPSTAFGKSSQTLGELSDEMEHRLAIEVARALGSAVMLSAFTPENLRWLCRSCHRRKTRQDRRHAKFLAACSLDWCAARRLLKQNRGWVLSFMLPCSLEHTPSMHLD